MCTRLTRLARDQHALARELALLAHEVERLRTPGMGGGS
jgi:hypothetical protein